MLIMRKNNYVLCSSIWHFFSDDGLLWTEICRYIQCDNTGYTLKNGAVSKVNKKLISHLTRAQRTPSAAASVHVSHALPAVRFSCLLRG